MKESPIIFSTPMVRALLNTKLNTWPSEPIDPDQAYKGQTRRLTGLKEINKNPDDWSLEELTEPTNAEIFGAGNVRFKSDKITGYNKEGYPICQGTRNIKSPYGQRGDLLYVRETAYIHIDYKKGENDHLLNPHHNVFYQATRDWSTKGFITAWYKKASSIHLPKKASRIWLQLTEDPYPERLWNVSEEDAISEAVQAVLIDELIGHGYKDYSISNYDPVEHGAWLTAIGSFKTLWQSIHGPESWEQNYWVWVLKFKVISTTGKPNQLLYPLPSASADGKNSINQ